MLTLGIRKGGAAGECVELLFQAWKWKNVLGNLSPRPRSEQGTVTFKESLKARSDTQRTSLMAGDLLSVGVTGSYSMDKIRKHS